MKKAVVLFNLGAPGCMGCVKPFLFNLFSDKAIIGLPNPLRYMIAKLISSKREKTAQDIYNLIGGGSPLLFNTRLQAAELEKQLNADSSADEYKVFVCMRYWHPMSRAVIQNITRWAPDEVVLLPLYPQFSTTTTASSFDDWERETKAQNVQFKTRKVDHYQTHPDYIRAHVDLLKKSYAEAEKSGKPRILFSAHGVPQKIIDKGDPYERHVNENAQAIMDAAAIDGADWVVCYQSKVGPLKWLEPSTEDEIRRAAADKVPLVIVPIAFISEHSETIVELDIEYKHIADELGLETYIRVPALGLHEDFIKALKDLTLNAK